MSEIDPQFTFRGLPLTAEQDASIRHYLKQKQQHGQPVDELELKAMLRDMLEPPGADDEGVGAATDDARATQSVRRRRSTTPWIRPAPARSATPRWNRKR